MEIATHEIFVTDYTEFLRINRNVQEASAQGVTLTNEKDKPFKKYDFHLIRPREALGGPLDFSRRSIERSMAAGWEEAKRVLG